MKYFLNVYDEKLTSFPAPGGNGCHPYLLRVANYGVRAGLTQERIYSDIRRSIPPGRRKVPDREILEAIAKAFSDHKKPVILPNGQSYNRYIPPKAKPVIHDGKMVLRNIIKQGSISTEVDLYDLSPIRLSEAREYDPILLLSSLYEPDELIWAGEPYDEGIIGRNIFSVSDWIEIIRRTGKIPPFFIINPLTGKSAEKMAGDGETYRGNLNIKIFKYALAEFDTLTHEDQIRFWSAVKLPIRSLVDTAGKSIHALIDVPKMAKVDTISQWQAQIKNRLYDQLLTPMGVDAACSNPARLSRLPGHYRTEKNSWQRLLWLSPVGRRI